MLSGDQNISRAAFSSRARLANSLASLAMHACSRIPGWLSLLRGDWLRPRLCLRESDAISKADGDRGGFSVGYGVESGLIEGRLEAEKPLVKGVDGAFLAVWRGSTIGRSKTVVASGLRAESPVASGLWWNWALPDGDCGGVMSPGSCCCWLGSTGSDAVVSRIVEAVSLSMKYSLDSSVGLGFRRSTTLLFFRPAFDLCRPAPRLSPVVADGKLTKDGLADIWPLPSSEPNEPLGGNVYVVLPTDDRDLCSLGVAGVEEPSELNRSEGAAQARKTASLIEGVNNDRVR